MKRLLLSFIATVMMVCVVGLVPSFAGDRKGIGFGEERNVIDTETPAREVRSGAKGVGGLSYIRENYTALAPSAGESYNQSAESVFYEDETIYLVDRYYVSAAGNYTRYYLIKDMVGYTVAFSASTSSLSSGYWASWRTISADFLGVGTYMYQSVTLGPGGPLTSIQFPFVVQSN